MAKQVKNEIVKKEDAQLPAKKQRVALGMENFQQKDMKLPRLVLAQSSSSWVKDDTAKEGDYVNSLSDMNYGNKVAIQPVYYTNTRIYWKRGAEEGWNCRSLNGKEGDIFGSCLKCKYSKWGEDNEPPACDEIHNYLCFIRAPKKFGGDPLVLSFYRTSSGEGVQLGNKIQYSWAPAWEKLYILTAKRASNKKFEWVIIKVDAGHEAPAEFVVEGENLYKLWAGKSMDVDFEDEGKNFTPDDEDDDDFTDDKPETETEPDVKKTSKKKKAEPEPETDETDDEAVPEVSDEELLDF